MGNSSALASLSVVFLAGCSSVNQEYHWDDPRSELPRGAKIGVLVGTDAYISSSKEKPTDSAFQQIEALARDPSGSSIDRAVVIDKRGSACLAAGDSSNPSELPRPVESCLDSSVRFHWIWGPAWVGTQFQSTTLYLGNGHMSSSSGLVDGLCFRHGLWDDSLQRYVAQGVERKKLGLFSLWPGKSVVEAAARERPLLPKSDIANGLSIFVNPLYAEGRIVWDGGRFGGGIRFSGDQTSLEAEVLALSAGRPHSYAALYGEAALGELRMPHDHGLCYTVGPEARLQYAGFVLGLGYPYRSYYGKEFMPEILAGLQF